MPKIHLGIIVHAIPSKVLEKLIFWLNQVLQKRVSVILCPVRRSQTSQDTDAEQEQHRAVPRGCSHSASQIGSSSAILILFPSSLTSHPWQGEDSREGGTGASQTSPHPRSCKCSCCGHCSTPLAWKMKILWVILHGWTLLAVLCLSVEVMLDRGPCTSPTCLSMAQGHRVTPDLPGYQSPACWAALSAVSSHAHSSCCCLGRTLFINVCSQFSTRLFKTISSFRVREALKN